MEDKFTEHQRKAGQSKSPKKAQAARDNLEKAREAKKASKLWKRVDSELPGTQRDVIVRLSTGEENEAFCSDWDHSWHDGTHYLNNVVEWKEKEAKENGIIVEVSK